MFSVEPHPLLRGAHVQTVLSSRVVRRFESPGRALLEAAERVTIDCGAGVRLQAVINCAAAPAPLVILLHGWLGQADSPYLRRAAHALHGAGFRIARLLLRDHGGTAALNREMFHSARIDEVASACNWLARRYGTDRTGVMGFSLGGNFAVRMALHASNDPSIVSVLAICPVIDPAATIAAIDNGWWGYRWWFLRKWRRAQLEKQVAFPDLYDLTAALRLTTVTALTEYFLAHHTRYPDVASYYADYTLTNDTLAPLATSVRIVAAAHDPVIPIAGIERLVPTRHLDVTISRYGGHCAFIETLGLQSAIDRAAPRYFAEQLHFGGTV